jgi:subtilisin family serine protease
MPHHHETHEHAGHDDRQTGHLGWWSDRIAHHGPADGGEGHYHYMRDQLLVADDDLDRVRGRLSSLGLRIRREAHEPRLGVTLLELDTGATADGRDLDVPALVDELHKDARSEVVPRVAPNHVLGPSTHVQLAGSAPAPTEWTPQDVDLPPNLPVPGSGVTVGLLDTGVVAETLWFRGRVRGDPEMVIKDGTGRLLSICGHGTFVAGMVLQYAPGAEVVVEGVFDESGVVNDLVAALGLLSLFDRGVDVVNMSIGAYSRNDRGMLAFERALDYVRFHRPDLVLVAAAGNDGLDRPVFPAADKRVIGVGSVEEAGGGWRRAAFSDYGWWVDACAPGVDLKSTFLEYTGPIVPHEEEPVHDHQDPDVTAHHKPEDLKFRGTAKWSGTSFSAPIVAAAVAMQIAGARSGPEAVRQVISHPGRPRMNNLGTFVNPRRYVHNH